MTSRPMSNIDKEWLQQTIAEMEEHRDLFPGDLDDNHENVLEAMRIALASLEAEAVEWRVAFRLDGQPGSDFEKTFENQAKMNEIISLHERAGFSASITPFYTAPPAPVSVPDRSMFEKWWESEHGSPLDSWDSLRTPDGYCDDGIDGQFEAWSACSAAMLQGAEPVTTDYKLPEETGSSLQLRNLIRQRHAEWSQATFGDVGPVGPLKHLSKEALEAAEEPEDLSEWADMQFLLWDAQRRAGISDGEITAAMEEKLKVNIARQWPEPKDGEPRLHTKPAPRQEVKPRVKQNSSKS